jgi:hypothetical protein
MSPLGVMHSLGRLTQVFIKKGRPVDHNTEPMKDNMPTLYKNIVSGLPDKLACEAFLWAVERSQVSDPMLYKAERFAREVSLLVSFLSPILDKAANIHCLQSANPDLLNFILKRHANYKYNGNQSALNYASIH